jgi:hypothetical protein
MYNETGGLVNSTVMRKKGMEADWAEKLMQVSGRETEEQERQFLALVDQAEGSIDLRIAKVLLSTYSAKPDYGTQERVDSVLATGNEEIVVKAILEEMPRLIAEAPEWAASLLGQELEHRFELLHSSLTSMPREVQNAVSQIVRNQEFSSFYPNAALLNP